LDAARQALILAKNDGTLPVSDRISTLTVLGYNADHAFAQNSFDTPVNPENVTITLLKGLRNRLPDTTITFLGAAVVEPGKGQEVTQIDKAVELAKFSDMTIVVVGDRRDYLGEWKPTARVSLPGDQDKLLLALSDVPGIKLVVVLMAGKPLIIPEKVINRANAVIYQIAPGMLGGQAFAEAIVGDINPSGRFPGSVPRHAGQIPVYYNAVRGGHQVAYADLTNAPQYAFGHGLTYSTSTWSDAKIDKSTYRMNEEVVLSLKVVNKGPYRMTELVQVYVHDVVTSVTWANIELKGFSRFHIDKDESKNVEIRVKVSELSLVNASEVRVVEPGVFELWVGRSSSDILWKLPFTVVE
jgi:beta-glucosidase